MHPRFCIPRFGPALARLGVILTVLGVGWMETLAFDAASPRLAAVLKQFVKDSRVDYAGLRARPDDLNLYIRGRSGRPDGVQGLESGRPVGLPLQRLQRRDPPVDRGSLSGGQY